MMKSTIALISAAIGGAGLLGATADTEPALPDISMPCYIDMVETEDGILLTAWGETLHQSSYRMVVTQRFGGGGFDIVQEGEIPLAEEAGDDMLVLSDMILDVEADFSAKLTTWNAEGDQICRWGERI